MEGKLSKTTINIILEYFEKEGVELEWHGRTFLVPKEYVYVERVKNIIRRHEKRTN